MALNRFLEAQKPTYVRALAELQAGAKRTHWMWFIFPQIAGLGRSDTARYYAIADRAEAEAYLAHPVLGARLAACTDAVLGWEGTLTAAEIFGAVDALKFASSMTLFEASGRSELYGRALNAFYKGERDKRTLELLGS